MARMRLGICKLRLVTAAAGLFAVNAQAFEIYGFVPYQSRLESGSTIRGVPSDRWFAEHGLMPIRVVYDNHILDIPKDKSKKNDALLNVDSLEKIAVSHKSSSSGMVSLDIETWDRFDSETPNKIIHLLRAYRSSHPSAKIGLYSTVPQNTYAWKPGRIHEYEKINERYSSVAKEVDYFSPSLYNYGDANFEDWVAGAEFNIKASRGYDKSKRVLPFITPEVRIKKGYRWLTYKEMMQRLEALKSLGADGCIVWASSRSRYESGEAPVLDPHQGWLKAVSDFSKRVQISAP